MCGFLRRLLKNLSASSCALFVRQGDYFVKKKKKLRGTASDSPLELLQKYSYVHAPLGAEDGDLQTDKCDQPISSLDNFTFGSNSFF